MKKWMRRMLSLLMAVGLAVTCLPAEAAASGSSELSTAHADSLNALGLFRGTEKGYELNARPDRTQGLVMLIRLLGREAEALAGQWEHPFADVSGWSEPYIGYAYQAGLTTGVAADRFGGSGALAPRDYVTFLLRSLGYSDAAGDFSWQYALSFAAQIGMMTTDTAVALSQVSDFNRGDMVDLSYTALTCPLSDGSAALAEKLAQDGVFTVEQGRSEGVIGAGVQAYNLYALRAAA